jgi:hypothetical protein
MHYAAKIPSHPQVKRDWGIDWGIDSSFARFSYTFFSHAVFTMKTEAEYVSQVPVPATLLHSGHSQSSMLQILGSYTVISLILFLNTVVTICTTMYI